MKRQHRAVVLLSGGLDSTTTLAVARHRGFACYALSFDYGQRHKVELRAARRVAKKLGVVEHVVVKLDLRVKVDREWRKRDPLLKKLIC